MAAVIGQVSVRAAVIDHLSSVQDDSVNIAGHQREGAAILGDGSLHIAHA